MGKRIALGFVGVVAIIFMCGNVLAANVSIDVNCTMKPGGSEEASIKKFKEIVEKNSGGRISVKIFMSGQLGKEKAVLELMKIGQTQMALTGGIFRTMFAKQYDPITIPFYLPTWECVKAYLEGPMGQKIAQLADEKGGVLDFGPQKRAARHMTSNRRIMGPDDINGLKMRLPAIPIWVDVWQELGALPTVIPAPEIYLAMKTGQVDALFRRVPFSLWILWCSRVPAMANPGRVQTPPCGANSQRHETHRQRWFCRLDQEHLVTIPVKDSRAAEGSVYRSDNRRLPGPAPAG